VTQPVFRFAPSPNGRLHLGHAYSALLNAELAKRVRGRFLLRIEDIDLTRCRPELEAGIYEDLAWLGLAWEEPVRRQSEHFGEYRAAVERLKARELVYPCFCSRKEIATAVAARAAAAGAAPPRDPDGAPLYPGTCRLLAPAEVGRRLAAGESHAWRLDVAKAARAVTPPLGYARFAPDGSEAFVAARPERWGDAIVARKEIPTSYHLAVVLDDALQGVTHVVRGQDLEAATDLHVVLQNLFDLPTPRYHHHALIRDEAGGKLSKILFSEPLADLRARGVTAEEVRKRLGFG
jgi:glutamyl-Q tRNA(Asp) synthetase